MGIINITELFLLTIAAVLMYFAGKFAGEKFRAENNLALADLREEILAHLRIQKKNTKIYVDNRVKTAKLSAIIPESPAESPDEKNKFWNDIEAMTTVRDRIAAGNFEDYQEIPNLARLMPLDAARYIDEAILKEQEKRGGNAPG